MSPPGRPKGESLSAQREGSPVNRPGRPKDKALSARRDGGPVDPAARIQALAAELGARLVARRLMLAAAESCTGGGIGFAVTQIAGSSGWFDRGFVTYSNAAKQQMLGVPAATLRVHGAVSEEAVRAMALGALACSAAQIVVAVTGVAGPGGGSRAKPVGTVWFGWALQPARAATVTLVAERHLLDGDRAAVRTRSIIVALRGLIHLLDDDRT